MSARRFNDIINDMRLLPIVAASLAIATTACKEEKTDMVHIEIDGNTVPTMLTRDVTTLISDSGITRYRITTPLWMVFDQATEPHWSFPESMHMEKFDASFNTDATIDCDSATYFQNKQLWRLDGNVRIVNTLGEKFLTQQIFWDQRDHKVYSDSFIHIEKQDRVIEGYGFKSNDRMTVYDIYRVAGIFPVSEFRSRQQQNDSIAPIDASETDSIQQPLDSLQQQ